MARECGIPLLDRLIGLDVTIDGADEVDGRLNAIKGGAARCCAKLVAAASRRLILIVDDSKCVDRLGRFRFRSKLSRSERS